MNFADGIILLLVAGAAVSALYYMRKRKREGKGCCGCSGCSETCSCRHEKP